MSISIFVIKFLVRFVDCNIFFKVIFEFWNKIKLDYDLFDRILKNFRIINEEFN